MTDLFHPPRLLRTREVAAYLSVTKETMEAYRAKGIGPPWVRLSSKAIRYPSAALNEWLATAEAQHTRTVRKGILPGMVHIGENVSKLSKEDMAEVERNHPCFGGANKQVKS